MLAVKEAVLSIRPDAPLHVLSAKGSWMCSA